MEETSRINLEIILVEKRSNIISNVKLKDLAMEVLILNYLAMKVMILKHLINFQVKKLNNFQNCVGFLDKKDQKILRFSLLNY